MSPGPVALSPEYGATPEATADEGGGLTVRVRSAPVGVPTVAEDERPPPLSRS